MLGQSGEITDVATSSAKITEAMSFVKVSLIVDTVFKLCVLYLVSKKHYTCFFFFMVLYKKNFQSPCETPLLKSTDPQTWAQVHIT